MLKVGITGGIGAGKTSVCRVFESLCVPVFYSDLVAEHLMLNNVDVKQKLIETIGKQTYLDSGAINKPFLSSVVFADESKRELVNSIVHPAVHSYFGRWCELQEHSYVLYESALLLEGNAKLVDFVSVVSAPVDERVSRLIERNAFTEQEALSRINSQMSEAERTAKSDFVINNSESVLIIPQVLELHQRFLKL